MVTNRPAAAGAGALAAGAGGQSGPRSRPGCQADGRLCHFTIAGLVVRTGLGPEGSSLTDVALGAGVLVAVDTKAPGGAHLFDPPTGVELTSAPLGLGGPPAFASGVLVLP